MDQKKFFSRREFLRIGALTGAGMAMSPLLWNNDPLAQDLNKPSTNITEALNYPRQPQSMPGRFPGKVIQVKHSGAISNQQIQANAVYDMIARGMLALTGAVTLTEAWRQLVTDKDRIGLKVNPVAGPKLSTSLEVTSAVVRQLQESGIPSANIIIWDRREFQLHECGFTTESFPNLRIIGTEYKDNNGSFYDADGKLYSLNRIDKKWYYWADTEDRYDAETLPYMVNDGKYSYFSTIVTQMCDKIINIPILKNAGPSVTLCLKNLAYGSITNTGRLHKQLWSETSAEVCAFPPLRDKVVLNIVDGIRGCYHGGPGADPRYFYDYQTILIGTDPVAVDRIGYDIVIRKRIEEKLQKEETGRGRQFINLAEKLGLGIGDSQNIQQQIITMS